MENYVVITVFTLLIVSIFVKDKMYKLKKLLKYISNRKISTIADIVLLLASSYFLFVKKGLNFSLTEYMVTVEIVKSKGMDWFIYYFVYFLYLIIFISIFIKVISLVCEKWKILDRDAISPDGMKTVCLNLNKEIEAHLLAIQLTDKKKAVKELSNHHHFDQNIRLTVLEMVDHIAESLSIEKKRKDIFVSIYAVKNFENGVVLAEYDQTKGVFLQDASKTQKLEYLNHWDPTSAHRYSAQIDFSAEKYQKYECVTAYKAAKYIHTSVDSKNYYCDPNNPRPKSTKNFLCFFITINDQVAGLVNIEFHNHKIFATDEEMIQYIQTDLMPFKYMIQYQFLKKRFLNALLP